MTRVLVVEDDPKILANLLFQLRDEGFAPHGVATVEEAEAVLHNDGPPELLLLDVRLPGGRTGLELVRGLVAADRLPPTVVISGEASISETVEALRLGVHDFIEKPFSKERLLQSLRNTLDHSRLRRDVESLRQRLDDGGGEAMIGRSEAMTELCRRLERVAPTDAKVLIRGESGTGKELVADALHRGSPRRQRPFVKINCAALPAALVEGELFGHARGAYTDAKSARPGLFEEADGGTLFLDEIGDMPLDLQARLLRVLEDGRVRRVGENRDRQVDVRVLAATHRDIEAAVQRGEFRQDLYFRLAHLPLDVPPLRQRAGDVSLLFEHYLEHFARRHRVRRRTIANEVMPLLERYSWPGNVRELRNLCERLVIFGRDPVTAEQLPSAFFGGTAPPETGLLRHAADRPTVPLREFRTRLEREYVELTLQRCGWNFSAAARQLGIGRTHLHQKAKDLGLRRPRPQDDSGEG